MASRWWTVRVLRGPLPDAVFQHTSQRDAANRAERLMNLHGVQEIVQRGQEYIVNGSLWYTNAKP